jgi:hypothetical protein
MARSIVRDERTNSVEHRSSSYGYQFIAFALLLDIMYRSWKFNEAPWDLFAIIILSGLIMTGYQYQQKILGHSWIKTVILTMLIAAAAAVFITLVIK